jgi:uncharacterized protein (TIGR03435 family)
MPMLRAILTMWLIGVVYGQPPAPRFEVATIKLTSPEQFNGPSGGKTGKGRIDFNNVTLKRCIMGAYKIGQAQIVGGPDWLDSIRFEIVAKADQPIDDDGQLMVMMQSLLADRFKLAVHQETRTLPAYVLEVGKNGAKLKKSEGGEAKTNSGHDSNGVATMDAMAITMDRFAEVLSRQMDLPVVNRTGLEGIFDLKLRWSPINSRPTAADSGPTIFTAIQELGLRLQSQKTPLAVLVIDRAEKPTEN